MSGCNQVNGRPHETDCPDPTEQFGFHTTCPCRYCLDTGYVGANPNDIECDCGADLQPEEVKLASCELIRLRMGSYE